MERQFHIIIFHLGDPNQTPNVIGSFNSIEDLKLEELLKTGKTEKKFVALSSAEHFHAINILSRFSELCSVLEVCKFAQDEITKI